MIIRLLHAYRLLLSPIVGKHCRFYPTCSLYAIEAVTGYGVVKGSWLALKRVCRCHPFAPGGVDLVPVKMQTKMQQIYEKIN